LGTVADGPFRAGSVSTVLVQVLTMLTRIYMIIYMRTTLVLNDELLRRAKRRAVERGLSVSDIVNESLRESLDRPAPAALPFSMITYGRSGDAVHHEPADFAAALEEEDRDRWRR
jgi:hypothetical protein